MRHAPTLRRAVTGSVLAVLAGSLLTAPPAVAADAPGTDDRVARAVATEGKYVALGDSFASGPAIQPMQTGGPTACARSTKNFASLIAAGRSGSFVDATCSGAKLTDLWAAQGEAPPQLDAVTRNTKLVTFGTLGGNDIGLVGIATNCVLGAEDCTGTPDDANHDKIEDLRHELSRGLKAIKKRAPQATIVMVGYGTYLPPGGCPTKLPTLTPDESDYLQGLINHLSQVIGSVARAHGVVFANQRKIAGAADHTPCADFADQWIRGIDVGDHTDGTYLHPTAAGMAATAGQITKALRAAKQRAVAAKKSVTLKATCKSRHARRVSLRVRGGKNQIERVVLRIGHRLVKRDSTAPYVAKPRAKKWRKVRGKPTAVVHINASSVRMTRTIKVKRPTCLRR